MGSRGQNNRVEAIKNAATGYAAVVLGIVCFIIALIVIVALVRLIVGASIASNSTIATSTGTAMAPSSSIPVLVSKAG